MSFKNGGFVRASNAKSVGTSYLIWVFSGRCGNIWMCALTFATAFFKYVTWYSIFLWGTSGKQYQYDIVQRFFLSGTLFGPGIFPFTVLLICLIHPVHRALLAVERARNNSSHSLVPVTWKLSVDITLITDKHQRTEKSIWALVSVFLLVQALDY